MLNKEVCRRCHGELRAKDEREAQQRLLESQKSGGLLWGETKVSLEWFWDTESKGWWLCRMGDGALYDLDDFFSEKWLEHRMFQTSDPPENCPYIAEHVVSQDAE